MGNAAFRVDVVRAWRKLRLQRRALLDAPPDADTFFVQTM
jgi:hypothetical protein